MVIVRVFSGCEHLLAVNFATAEEVEAVLGMAVHADVGVGLTAMGKGSRAGFEMVVSCSVPTAGESRRAADSGCIAFWALWKSGGFLVVRFTGGEGAAFDVLDAVSGRTEAAGDACTAANVVTKAFA